MVKSLGSVYMLGGGGGGGSQKVWQLIQYRHFIPEFKLGITRSCVRAKITVDTE